MFCLECSYPLDHLKSSVCPECGREFDRVDEQTYRSLPGPVLDDPVTVARLPITQAVGLCIRLEQAGIVAALHEERGGVIAYAELPTGSVWVERDDHQRAREIAAQPIVDEAEDQVDHSQWVCASCGERVEGQFTSCWKCGAERADF
jgi:hypothetical protein